MANDANKPVVRSPKLQIQLPPGIYAKGMTRKQQKTTLQRVDIPLHFRFRKGRTTACTVDVVVDVLDNGRVTRSVLRQYVLSIMGSTGQLYLRPLQTKVPSVPPAFTGGLTLPQRSDDAEVDDAEEDAVEGEETGDADAT